MHFPEPLKQGDKVFLVCTSSPIFEEDIKKCKKVMKNLGFEPVLGESLFENISIVFQEVTLFNTSILENIRFGNKNATDDEVIEAAKLANCDSFVSNLPDGYMTTIGENGKLLSGGEKQRISIARAILENPQILILDEATSALDNESEQLVQDALEKLMKGKTTFVIAHRLSTIINSDKIVVIQQGEIKEVGSHEELLDKDGIYKSLYNKSFKN